MALTRLVLIIPFNLLDYGFGMTQVPFWTYVFWTWLGMLPGTALYVMSGEAFIKVLTQGRISWDLMGVLAAVAIILFFLVRSARIRLQLKQYQAPE